jgi:hypothetical protein
MTTGAGPTSDIAPNGEFDVFPRFPPKKGIIAGKNPRGSRVQRSNLPWRSTVNRITILLAALLAAGVAMGSAAVRSDEFVVHEWGTFLSMNGSDGMALDGMYHEEHALPSFVHSRRKDQLQLPTAMIKGETPVIYFYSQIPRQVNVSVDFPSGIWTQWYPRANMVGPALASTNDPLNLKDGRIRWNVEVIPSLSESLLPETSSDALWNYSRQVDSAFVRVKGDGVRLNRSPLDEVDRFIFYRGLGRAELPIQFSAASNGAVTCSASAREPVRHLFLIRVEKGRGAFKYAASLAPGEQISAAVPSMESSEPLESFSQKAGDAIARRLAESGLFEKEARAMVNTWRTSYLETQGVRALYVLPRAWTDRFIPMKIDPKPSSLVRVMVGRTELLTPERERAAESAVKTLASADSVKRRAAFDYLIAQGRYVEPIVRRTLASSRDGSVKELCNRILLTDFVTELRSALKDSRGKPTFHTPVFARARLSQLLRDIGLNDEAAAEGRAALAELALMKQPPMNSHDARHYLRASARASEGTGDSVAALNWYGKFVKFAAQPVECGTGCHAMEGPTDRRFFRDWWAGARFAKYAAATGETDRLVASYERALKTRPTDVEARMGLGYLYAASGNKDKSAAMFGALEASESGRKAARK